MKDTVRNAVSALTERFGQSLRAEDIGDGGAKVIVSGLSLDSGPYVQTETWCGFTITFAHPFADIYPHHIRPDLCRKDGTALGQGFHPNNSFYGTPALMLSRRIKLVGPENPMDAILKLEKVMHWLRSR